MKKTIEWKTPKVYQKGWLKEARGWASKKPSWFCKRLKMRHDYVWKGTTSYSWSPNEAWEHYTCTGCGKQKEKRKKSEQAKEEKV